MHGRAPINHTTDLSPKKMKSRTLSTWRRVGWKSGCTSRKRSQAYEASTHREAAAKMHRTT